MTSAAKKAILPPGLGLLGSLALMWANLAGAQAPGPFAPPTTPMAQRNSMNLVINQASWLQSGTRSASSYGSGGYGLLVRQFQAVRDQYNSFRSTLNPQQLSSGANRLAELDLGLQIIQEALSDYQAAVANGQSSVSAMANLRSGLNEAMGVWVREFKQDCRQLRVGW